MSSLRAKAQALYIRFLSPLKRAFIIHEPMALAMGGARLSANAQTIDGGRCARFVGEHDSADDGSGMDVLRNRRQSR